MNAPPVPIFKYQHLPTKALIQSPSRLQAAAQAYFHQTMPNGPSTLNPSGDHPTPEGLALSFGWPSFQKMKQAISTLLQNEPDSHRESIATILAAAATLQDYYLKHGLSSAVNVTMVKFLSSAYFDTHERTTQETTINTNSKTFVFKVETTAPATPEEALEIARLEAEMEEQTRAELVQIGHDSPDSHVTDEVLHDPKTMPRVTLNDIL